MATTTAVWPQKFVSAAAAIVRFTICTLTSRSSQSVLHPGSSRSCSHWTCTLDLQHTPKKAEKKHIHDLATGLDMHADEEQTRSMLTHTNVLKHIHTKTQKHTWMHTHTHTHTHTHMRAHAHTHTHASTHARMHTCVFGTQTQPNQHTCGQFKLCGRGDLHWAWVDMATSVSELWHKEVQLKHTWS